MYIGYMIKKISNQMMAGHNEQLKKDGLTSTQLEFLIYLEGRKDELISQKDISEHFSIKHTTTIHTLKRLEEKRLIYREINQDNAKYRDVHLTEEGRDKVAAVYKKRSWINDMVVADMTEQEQAELKRLLAKVYENVLKIKEEEQNEK